ncbi:MAG: KAP family NTPase [Nitrosopumilus sp.]|nr:KAP family NTPase [Nitrosopumilus sp.]
MDPSMIREMRLLTDEPEGSDLHFGFEEQARSTAILLKKAPAPFVVAIDGEWGSGKTTLIRRIMEILERDGRPPKMIEINAWRYESTDLFTALLGCIKKRFPKRMNRIAGFVSLILDIISRDILRMSTREVGEHFEDLLSEVETIEELLTNTAKERLVIFIDDLDRCSIDNMLAMLENVKLFLMMENVVVVIAIDMEKIEHAWNLKHGKESSTEAGVDYVDKLFQLKLPVPHKQDEDLVEYVWLMAPSLARVYAEYLVNILPPNLRKMKLALNFIYFAVSTTDNFPPAHESSSRRFFAMMAWYAIRDVHKDFANKVKKSPRDLIILTWLCTNAGSYFEFQKTAGIALSLRQTNKQVYISDKDGNNIMTSDLVTEQMLDLMSICISDSKIFRILYHFGENLGIEFDPPKHLPITERDAKAFEPAFSLFESIVRGTGT